MRRHKALVIMAFVTDDAPLSRVHRAWNRDVPPEAPERIKMSTSMDFLVAREKQNKRLGFIQIDLDPNESVPHALRRHLPFYDTAVKRGFERIDSFRHRGWDVDIGWVEVREDQRAADLSEQSDDLPYTVEWQTPHWFYRQLGEGYLNEISEHALKREAVRAFLSASQRRKAA
jgi:hypothetical protein